MSPLFLWYKPSDFIHPVLDKWSPTLVGATDPYNRLPFSRHNIVVAVDGAHSLSFLWYCEPAWQAIVQTLTLIWGLLAHGQETLGSSSTGQKAVVLSGVPTTWNSEFTISLS